MRYVECGGLPPLSLVPACRDDIGEASLADETAGASSRTPQEANDAARTRAGGCRRSAGILPAVFSVVIRRQIRRLEARLPDGQAGATRVGAGDYSGGAAGADAGGGVAGGVVEFPGAGTDGVVVGPTRT